MTAKEYLAMFPQNTIDFAHIDGQHGPFYACGTIFCDHASKQDAHDCWERRCKAWQEKQSELERLVRCGALGEADRFLYSAGFVVPV